MIRTATIYLATLASFLLVDAVWLTVMTARLYRPLTGHLLADSVAWAPAVLFYLLYAAGIVCLAVLPSRRWEHVLARGALLGLVAYGTYDLTNHATLKGWPLAVTLADMAWGTMLTAAAAVAGYLAAARP
ncbi:membrane protein [Labrys miyagiensis]